MTKIQNCRLLVIEIWILFVIYHLVIEILKAYGFNVIR
jgi:hypothetical protein